VEFHLPRGEVAHVQVESHQFILEAARVAGLHLPSMCEQGWCTTCTCRVLNGQVDQAASRRFFPADRQAGFALICTGRPLSDLVLRTHQHPAMRQHREELGLPVPKGVSVSVD
jgi:ferredoxin